MEKTYSVYLIMNRTLEELFFGHVDNSGTQEAELPAEISHWDWCNHAIANPVIMAEKLSCEEALCEICSLQEKVKADPQGKKLLENSAAVRS